MSESVLVVTVVGYAAPLSAVLLLGAGQIDAVQAAALIGLGWFSSTVLYFGTKKRIAFRK